MPFSAPYKTQTGRTIIIRGDTKEDVIRKARAAEQAEIADAATGRGQDPVESMGPMERFGLGVGRGMQNTGLQAGNILGLVSDERIAEENRLAEPLTDTTAGAIGEFVGEVAATAPIGMGAGAGVARGLGAGASALGRSAPWLARTAGAATEGAVEGALFAGPENRGTGALVGAGLAGGLSQAGDLYRALRNQSRGVGRDAPRRLVQRAENMGLEVDLTPGQAVPGGIANALEHGALARQMTPIKSAREAAQEQAVDVFLNAARPPGGLARARKGGETAGELLSDVYDDYRRAYDMFRDTPISVNRTGIAQAVQRPYMTGAEVGSGLASDALKTDTAQLTKFLSGLPENPNWGDLQRLRSNIRGYRRRLLQSGPQEPARMDVLGEAEEAITRRLTADLGEPEQNLLRAIDAKYADYKVAEDAVYRGARLEGETLTPANLRQAVMAGNRHQRGRFARGEAGGVMRDIARDIGETFTQAAPPTGVTMAIPALTGAAGTMAGTAVGFPAAGAALGYGTPAAIAMTGAGTKTGRRLGRALARQRLQGDLTPQMLRQAATAAAINSVVDDYSE